MFIYFRVHIYRRFFGNDSIMLKIYCIFCSNSSATINGNIGSRISLYPSSISINIYIACNMYSRSLFLTYIIKSRIDTIHKVMSHKVICSSYSLIGNFYVNFCITVNSHICIIDRNNTSCNSFTCFCTICPIIILYIKIHITFYVYFHCGVIFTMRGCS